MKGLLPSFFLSILEGNTQCKGRGIPPRQPVCRSRLLLQLMLLTETVEGSQALCVAEFHHNHVPVNIRSTGTSAEEQRGGIWSH